MTWRHDARAHLFATQGKVSKILTPALLHSPDATVMLGSYAPVSQKGQVLRAIVKEMEGQQTATKFLLTTPPCLISATLQSVHALYNGCPRGCSGLLSVWRGQLCCTLYLRLSVLLGGALFCCYLCVIYVFAIPSESVQ